MVSVQPNGMSEMSQRISQTPFMTDEKKLEYRARMRKRNFKEHELPFPEVAFKESQPEILPVIDSVVRVCIADVADIAGVAEPLANALISDSLARIHFAGK